MIFENIVGQEIAKKNIINALNAERISHAYIFSGPDGTGKSIMAFEFAKKLNCKSNTGPCEKCSSCVKANSLNHPNILHLKPAKHGRSEKYSISIEDIRKLQIDMQRKPYENGYKIYIIYSADLMTEQAQNGLLKILEEPPSYVIILLLLENQYSLLGTILSRCQPIKFSRVKDIDIQNYLVSNMQIDNNEARYVAILSQGIVGRAIEILKNESIKKNREDIINIARDIYNNEKLLILSYVDYFLKNKDNINYILDIFILWFRDILLFKECNTNKYLINMDKSDLIRIDSVKYNIKKLESIINSISNAKKLINTNVNFQLVIENMLLEIGKE